MSAKSSEYVSAVKNGIALTLTELVGAGAGAGPGAGAGEDGGGALKAGLGISVLARAGGAWASIGATKVAVYF